MHVHIERFENGQAGIAVIVHVVTRHDREVRAAVQEKTRVHAERDVVVAYGHVVTPLRRDDPVVAYQSVKWVHTGQR